jgi:hypothetical protein
MEDKNQMENMGGHECKMCKMMGEIHGKMCPNGKCHFTHTFIKLVICFIILGVIFAIGVKLGELKSNFSGGYSKLPGCYYMMNRSW